MNAITCVGLRLNLLSYPSLKLVNPPNPPGRFTPELCFAISLFIYWTIKMFLQKDL